MKENKGKRQMKHGKAKWIAGFALFAVLLIGGLSAKYITEYKKNAQMKSSNFYFTSDYLEENTKTYDITDWSDGFDIELYNYDKKNDTLVSEDEITYTVSITGSGNWSCTEDDGKLSLGNSDNKKNKKIIHIKPGATAEKGDEITVTVTTTSPYKKTILATFKAASSKNPEYTIHDEGDGSVSLVIGTNDYEGQMIINWDKDLFDPDSTNKHMKDWEDSAESATLNVEKNTTYKLLFFKNTIGNISDKKGNSANITLPTT